MTDHSEKPVAMPKQQSSHVTSAVQPKGKRPFGHYLERISSWSSHTTGSSSAFIAAVMVIAAWLVTGPFFHYSDTWQLVINTSTTIVTFLMVFLIQRSQNKESSAIQLKLNELIAAVQGASNHLISVEDRSEEEIRTLREHYAELVDLMQGDADITKSHSVEEAQNRHRLKVDAQTPDEGA